MTTIVTKNGMTARRLDSSYAGNPFPMFLIEDSKRKRRVGDQRFVLHAVIHEGEYRAWRYMNHAERVVRGAAEDVEWDCWCWLWHAPTKRELEDAFSRFGTRASCFIERDNKRTRAWAELASLDIPDGGRVQFIWRADVDVPSEVTESADAREIEGAWGKEYGWGSEERKRKRAESHRPFDGIWENAETE